MEFNSQNYGKLQYDQNDLVCFKEGIPGRTDLKEFILVDLEDHKPFRLLQSLEDSSFGLIVTEPGNFVEGYEFDAPDSIINSLGGINSQDDVMVLSVITARGEESTINLHSPIVASRSTHLANQFDITDQDYAIRTPLFS